MRTKLKHLLDRWRERAAGIMTAVAFLMIACAPLAHADTGTIVGPLAWIELQDTRGISIWQHDLSLDRGTGFPFNPEKFFWSAVTDFSWSYYRNFVALVLWFLDWVLRLEWMGLIAAPLLEIGDALQRVVNDLGLVPTFLTITAAVAGLWMLRGRMATGLWDVLIACIISSLAIGVFAHPVRMVAGPDGYIVNANHLGQEVVAALATGDAKDKDPETLRRAQTGQLVDVFVRQPLQMINYGKVVDGTPCEATYNEAAQAGPYGPASTMRDKIAACDKALGDYAAAPSANMAGSALIFQPSGFIILLLAVLLGGSVLAASVWAMYQSVHAIWALVSGLLPGGSRGSILQVIAEVFVSLVIIVFTSVYLGVFLLVVQAMFKGSDNPARTFVLVDIILVVGIIVFVRKRAQLKGMSQRIAKWLAWRPGGSPTQIPDRRWAPNPVGAAVRTAANLGQLGAQMAGNRRPLGTGQTYFDNRQQAVIIASGLGTTPSQGRGYAYQTHPTSSGPSSSVVVPGEVVGGDSLTPLVAARRGPELPGGPERRELPPGPGGSDSGTGGGGPSPTGPGGGAGTSKGAPAPRLTRAQRAKKVGATLVRAGTSAAASYLTGGASTVARVATKAGGTLRTARRAALGAKLATGRKPSAPRVGKFTVPSNAPTTPSARPAPQPKAPQPKAPQPKAPQPKMPRADVEQLQQRLADRARSRRSGTGSLRKDR